MIFKTNHNTPGSDNLVFVVAELSANHNGSLPTAIETIRAAKRAGADAIKLQTYTADTLTLKCDQPEFKAQAGSIWEGQYLYDIYQAAQTPWEWHEELFRVAEEEGLVCFSSPFDKTAVDLLEKLHCPIYKIASFEITDIPLIEYAAAKGKPVFISTGIAGIEDIESALDACRRMGNDQVVLLKCTSDYPAPVKEANLLMINDMAKRFGVMTGLSDHTLGITVPIAATVLGAKVIEKHFIIDRSIGGPDASFSLNEAEFTAMVKAVREAEAASGKVDYALTDKMLKNREFARSLYVVEDIKAGEALTEKNIRSIRPGHGLHPKYYSEVIGKTAKGHLAKGQPLHRSDINN